MTESAPKDIFSYPTVGLHMSSQLGALGTGVVTQLTLVGFLSGVGSSVHGQVRAVFENFSAVLASVVSSFATELPPCGGIEEGIQLAFAGDGL